MQYKHNSQELDEGTRRKMNELARHQVIDRIYKDILFDMRVCEIEGWDKLEYIRMLQELLNGFRVGEKTGNNDLRSNAGGLEGD